MKNTKVGNRSMMLFQYYITEDGKMYKNDDVIQDQFGHTYTIVKFINHKRRKNKLDNSAISPDNSDKFAQKSKENVGAAAPIPA